MNSSSVQTFDLYALRFALAARRPLALPEGTAGNVVRGRFGMALRRASPEEYGRLFAPRLSSGPSGLADSPRPFVLRVRHLDGASLMPGERFQIGMNMFETRDPQIDLLAASLADGLAAECLGFEGGELLRLPITSLAEPIARVRVQFLTPTEIKPSDSPEFGLLFARIRDRVSTLRSLYGAGPLEIDFQAMGERAAAVRMTRCEIEWIEAERVSRATGQKHSLGGFIGVAEYEGELAEFVPYLEIARWTGVGRQTVWGKGEIGWETF